jgi:3-oxocholest-4-en-26-oate---CoA ligase
MTGGDWSLAAVHDLLAETVPDRPMVVYGDLRRTFAEVAQRSRSIASFLGAQGVGLRAERPQLERWECGQDPIALVLHNCPEYIEAMLGAYRARAVPFNVNQHYQASEMTALFENVGVKVVVYHRRYGALVSAACDGRKVLFIDVDDGSGNPPVRGSLNFEEVATTAVGTLPRASPDDLYLVCTGGTTGRPKAVLWRQADIYVSGMAGSTDTTGDSLVAATARESGPWYPVPPLMHAAAQWTAFSGLHLGATVVLHDDSGPFDARQILEIAERERVALMSIVGDAYAGPIVEELRRRPYDLSSLTVLGTGGAATSEHHKEAILSLVPHVMIRDGYGSSETGGMAFGAQTKRSHRYGFAPSDGATVVSEDRSRMLEPGDTEVGWTARRGRVPLGYLGDRTATESTFPIIDEVRVAIPGDRAQLSDDGRIIMLGRDALVINTGGEKVFVEEVEEVVRRHPGVADALVVGRPSERFGQEVVAVVAPRANVSIDPGSLREFVAGEIARFKAPRAVALCDKVQRHANGKPDYAWAQSMARAAASATESG